MGTCTYDLPKVRRRGQMLHCCRKYFLKASEVYAMLRQQQAGFANVPGHVFRRAIREHLLHSDWNMGRRYLSRPGHFHLPECDVTDDWGWGCALGENDRRVRDLGWRVVRRYSHRCVEFIAPWMPFCCPRCGGGENPLKAGFYLPPVATGKQLICLDCWETIKAFCTQTPAVISEIDDLIKKLNKEITNAHQRRRERRGASQQFRGESAGRDVRYA